MLNRRLGSLHHAHADLAEDDLLPRAMTCGNMLQLPSYTSKARLRCRFCNRLAAFCCQERLKNQLLKACEMGLSMQLV